MAGRILNRRRLREQAEQPGQPEAGAAEAPAGAGPPDAQPKKAPAKKAPTPRKKAVKKPTRMRARWGLFDSAMKLVAVFEYSQRAAADAALAAAQGKKKGLFFLQIVKDALPEAAPAPPAALP
jgi:hypothetical protein